ncbi:MAG: CsbD family protein [Burkholderia sp.]|nr:CsbD family protein [Burkholderia sp.]
MARLLDAYRRKGTDGSPSTDQAKGSIKEAAGKVTGDTKLQAEGTLDKATGKVESAIGGVKDAIRKDL